MSKTRLKSPLFPYRAGLPTRIHPRQQIALETVSTKSLHAIG